ncbi:MAG: trypsin-like serine protease [Acidobacteriota bacterium]
MHGEQLKATDRKLIERLRLDTARGLLEESSTDAEVVKRYLDFFESYASTAPPHLRPWLLPSASWEDLVESEIGVQTAAGYLRWTVALTAHGGIADQAVFGRPPDFPEVVSLNFSNRIQGSGVLLRADVVLTAAHVLEKAGDDLKAWVGVENKEVPSEQKYPVIERRVADGYDKNYPYPNDLALLRLERPTGVTEFPQLASSTDIGQAGAWLSVGFGEMSDGEVGLRNIAHLGSVLRLGDMGIEADRDLHLQVNSCNLDSGGGLYVSTDNGSSRLAGITSRGLPPADAELCTTGTYYTRLDHGPYATWIEQTLTAWGAA